LTRGREDRMKIEYSKEADAIYVYFKEEFVASSKEIEDGVVIDFDKEGQLIGIEVLDVSQRFSLSDIVGKIGDGSLFQIGSRPR
jgi:uncharacterized protein YuzE